jgi:hypothetical protein
MFKRFHSVALILGLVLASPAVAETRTTAGQLPALIDISALTIDSDFTVFMREDVPKDVRTAALRRLWVLMQLPVSCHDLCYEAEPTVSGYARLASEKLPVAAQ